MSCGPVNYSLSMSRSHPALAAFQELMLMTDRQRILFLCTGNSCRSQMAEGLARHAWGDDFEFMSAGVERHGMNPLAIKAMQEVDIDITGHTSKTVDDLPGDPPDIVITVCDHANESCPVFPGPVRRIHVGFEDPPRLAANAETEEEAMVHYRRVRDDIADYIKTLPETLPG